MFALYDEQREALLRIALMVFVGGLAVLPLTVAPVSISASAQPHRPPALLPVPAVPSRLEFPAIEVRKDPFIPDAAIESAPSSNGIPVGAEQDVGIVLPANAGAGEAPPSLNAPGAIVVRGIVLGDEPQALVDLGNGVKVLGIGDRIGPDTITAIDATGLTVSSGARFKIAGASR